MKAIVIAMLLAGTFAHAQTTETSLTRNTSEMRVIPTLGIASMKVTGEGTSGWGSDLGLSVGGLVELGSGMAGFQTGLLFNQFGAKTSIGSATVKVNLNYLSVPALAKINFMGNPDQTVYLKAGLMPSFITSKSAKVEADGFSASTSNVTGVKSFDLPAVVGFGGAFPTSLTSSINVEANFVRSLTSITDEGTSHNEGFIIGAGFSLSM